ncbi:MAG: hypothetical protein KJP16_03385 [Gammaproteobacteria bacterium]|nr:hypothetical protein [Gammaproteobacteria bacterium]NNC56339.1 hypothetical protein [Woeseiaceae bacterium]NNL49837.1 hypothetical protein [Woeseiaceae bacterium]
MIAKTRSTLSVSLLLLALAGCGSNVTMIEPTIPAPRIEKIPINVALRIPEEFKDFVHEENVLGKESWTIHLGNSNATFFEQLFGYLFDGVTVIGPDDDARNFAFDALIEPSIDGFEFSVPNQSKTEAFAVWIRYRLRIFDREGNNASNWTVSAYGKSQKQGIGGSDSLQRAAVLAMRDAAALIIMQMDKATNISSLAGGGLAPPTSRPVKVAADTSSNQVPDDEEEDFGVFAIGGIDDEAE